MRPEWRRTLERWHAAGFIDAETSDRIVAYEESEARPARLEWPVALALILGGIAIGAGLLLFVAANWQRLSPNTRFGIVLFLVALFHFAGAVSSRDSKAFAAALHGIGTAALGAGIALTAQIYNLPTNSSKGLLLWMLGALGAWALLRDAVQLSFAAILTPAWLAVRFVEHWPSHGSQSVAGLLLIAIVYFTQLAPARGRACRIPLVYIGGISLLPLAFIAALHWNETSSPLSFTVALLPGLSLAAFLLGRDSWLILPAAVWIVAFRELTGSQSFLVYLWCALGAVGLIAWGWRDGRKERINLGVAGFALSVLCFYVSNVLDKLGRSASLITLGLLLLGGGWVLERARRKLVARV